jgi:hypothetical protein
MMPGDAEHQPIEIDHLNIYPPRAKEPAPEPEPPAKPPRNRPEVTT